MSPELAVSFFFFFHSVMDFKYPSIVFSGW